MVIRSAFLIGLFLLKYFVLGEEYENDLKERYPDYGETWMYIPDGDGVPRAVNLSESPQTSPRGHNKEMLVHFWLYTRRNKDNYMELDFEPGEEASNEIETGRPFNNDNFDPKKDTKVLIHGYWSSGNSPAVVTIKDAYLSDRDCNVIIVDWEELASSLFYFTAASNTKVVGNKTGRMMDYLISEHNMEPQQFHIVGHSLGAHASGFAGRFAGPGKVGRITGLDPALPGFEYWAGPEDRLDPSDAQFVDVLHTCAGVLGYSSPLGHADFYPNGGKPSQPGCTGMAEIVEACSHGRSHEFYVESINRPLGFLGRYCNNERELRDKHCSGDSDFMGDTTPPTARGIYHLQTNPQPPYSRNLEEEEDEE